jgi:alkylhydroperoxidase/carboxymuconolactone decarboxylase family protein YurZ
MKIADVIADLEFAYGKADWIDTMAAMGPDATNGFAFMVKGILNEGPLPAKIKHFMLFVVYCVKGYEPMARLHARAANLAGATPEEWHDVLMTFIPSRGPMIYMEGARILGLKKEGNKGDEKELSMESVETVLEYFRKIFDGSLPAYINLLTKHKPALLKAYYKMRSENLKDGVLPQKYKELMLVCLNAAERYQWGVGVHVKTALGSGATGEEIIDAMATSILGGGIPAFREAVVAYEDAVR